MTPSFTNLILSIRREARGLLDSGPTDDDLLARFVNSRDSAAFEELLRRYGPMVMAVCRRCLADRADAEDAFQATFLALVTQASAIRSQSSLGAWLHTAAFRIAKRARQTGQRTREIEAKRARPEQISPSADADGFGAVLDEELNRLPDRYRHALLLCCVLERPLAEVGHELGLSTSGVWKRVQKGRELLRKRLESRGVAVSSAVLTALLATGSATGLELGAEFASSALGCTEAPERIAALARAAVPATRRTWSWFAVVSAAVLLGAAGYLVAVPNEEPEPRASIGEIATPVTDPEPLAVLTGVVRTPDGRPVPFARVDAFAKEFARGTGGGTDRVLASATADAEGRYRIPVPPFAVPVVEDRRVRVVATGPTGEASGSGEVLLRPGEASARADLGVSPKRTLRGRVLGPLGLPIAGARLTVTRCGGVQIDPVVGEPHRTPSNWPEAAVSDSDGRFEIPGMPAHGEVTLETEHPEHGFAVSPVDEAALGRGIVVRVGPLRRLNGRVIAERTGRPVSEAKLLAVSAHRALGLSGRMAKADADGRFSLLLPDGETYSIQAFPPEGMPVHSMARLFAWPVGSSAETMALALPEAIVLRGTVTDSANGAAISGARVQFVPQETANPHYNPEHLTSGPALVAVGCDGRFEIAIPPGPGHLLVHAPSLEYLATSIDSKSLFEGSTGGTRVYAHAFLPLDFAPGDCPAEVRVPLRRGTGIEVRAVLPNGEPMRDGFVLCRHFSWPFSIRNGFPLPVRDGRVRIPGCEPGRTYNAAICDSAGEYGASVDLACPRVPASEPVVVSLKPTGYADVRFVGKDGLPRRGPRYKLVLQMPVDVPSDFRGERPMEKMSAFLAKGQLQEAGPAVGPDGKLRLPALIPGARYQFASETQHGWSWGDFIVRPGNNGVLTAIVSTE